MRDKGALKDMPYSKTVEIIVEDATELQQIMYIYLVENGVFNLNALTGEQLLVLKNPKHRLKFINDFIDVYLYANAIWQHTNVHTYDSYLPPICEQYVADEFKGFSIDSSKLPEVFSIMERDIINFLPVKLLNKTWCVWSVSMVAQSVVLRNEGDFRILSFAKDASENKKNPFYGKVSKGTLYHNEKY